MGEKLLSLLVVDDAIKYHLIYHHSFGLRVNHLIFLQTYQLGVFLCASAAGGVICLCSVVGFLCLYTLLLSGQFLCKTNASVCASAACASYLGVLGSLGIAAQYLQLHFSREMLSVVGITVLLGSFILQLIGHALCEDLHAPPRLFHGFVAAPPLEHISLLLSCGCFGESFRQSIMDEVEETRARELKLKFPLRSS
jgi:hypothetical protein